MTRPPYKELSPVSKTQEWYTISEAAEYMRCSRQTIYRELKAGNLAFDGKVSKKGRRFSLKCLETYMRGNIKNGGMARSNEENYDHAYKKTEKEKNRNTWHPENRSQSLQGSCEMDRSENRKKSGSEKNRKRKSVRGNNDKRETSQKGGKIQTYERVIRRLRSEVAKNP